MANIIITGGSGFIGSNLTTLLKKQGHHITVVDLTAPRQPADNFIKRDLTQESIPPENLATTNAIIHLAGRNLLGRVNEQHKNAIYETRVLSTRNLIEALKNTNPKPITFISASAIGYYGDRPDEDLDESASPGSDFLARLCTEWEKEARQAENLGIRTVQMRTAPVLGEQGVLDRLLPLYRMRIGAPLNNNNRWFPWIHIDDLINSYRFALENEQLKGPVNAVSPGHITHQQFSEALATALSKPTWLHVPTWAVQLMYKDLAKALIASLKVHPKKLEQAGFTFKFKDIHEALNNIIHTKKQS